MPKVIVNKLSMWELIKRTIWVIHDATGSCALNYKGEVVAQGKFKNLVELSLKKEAVERDIYAIASVVHPSQRIPKRKVSTRRMR